MSTHGLTVQTGSETEKDFQNFKRYETKGTEVLRDLSSLMGVPPTVTVLLYVYKYVFGSCDGRVSFVLLLVCDVCKLEKREETK